MIELFLFLHILLFVFSFAFTAGLSIYLDRLAATRDRAIIHAAFGKAHSLSLVGGLGWILTALVGAALAGAMGVAMDATWLVGAYAAFAVLIVVGFFVHRPWQAKVIAASAPAPQGDLNALLSGPAHRIASMLSALSVLIILYLMTAQPG